MKRLIDDPGPPTEAVRLTFSGRLTLPHFAEFCVQRAKRLDLELAICGAEPDRFVVEVSGQRELVGAFEMACSLGPLDCLVLDCRREGKLAP